MSPKWLGSTWSPASVFILFSTWLFVCFGFALLWLLGAPFFYVGVIYHVTRDSTYLTSLYIFDDYEKILYLHLTKQRRKKKYKSIFSNSLEMFNLQHLPLLWTWTSNNRITSHQVNHRSPALSYCHYFSINRCHLLTNLLPNAERKKKHSSS